jgi:transcriptional regulator with GAF, ATPase, and Fis domain
LCAHGSPAFADHHQEILRPVAALLGSAMEHWRMWQSERRRRERLESVETLLGSLAESLDVREVFQSLSAEMQSILPHHLMNLTEIDRRARTIRIVAFAGECDLPIRTDAFSLTEQELEGRDDFAIVRDVSAEIPPDTERNRLILASGLRSWIHVPVWLSGEVKGSLSFLHREPFRYSRDDAVVALLVAARVALTLSHQRLAEEARAATESRERAERLEAAIETLGRELESRTRGRAVGVSRSWKETLRQVSRVADSDTTVLITGESGTGKEVIASLVHRGSSRAGRPFVAVNCAALPEQLLESELFGHEKGAFTGAIATKIGRIEQAERGTLFLDEIAEMTPAVQAKFLRFLEEREFQRLGGTRTLEADVRIIAATNRDLPASIEGKTFRQDLYYRLNVFEIHIAPLRQRREDIVPLADTLLEDLGQSMGRSAMRLSAEAQAWLLEQSWPGNVRELRNAIERAILLCDGGAILPEHLHGTVRLEKAAPRDGSPDGAGAESYPDEVDLDTMERRLIGRALLRYKGNKSQAARALGLSRAQLYSRLEKHGLH